MPHVHPSLHNKSDNFSCLLAGNVSYSPNREKDRLDSC